MTDNKSLTDALDLFFRNLGFGTSYTEPEVEVNKEEPVNVNVNVNVNDFNADDISKIIQDKADLDKKNMANEIELTVKAVFDDIMQMIIAKKFKTIDNGNLIVSMRGPLKKRAYIPISELQKALNVLLNEKGLELKYAIIIPMNKSMFEDYQLSVIKKPETKTGPLKDQ